MTGSTRLLTPRSASASHVALLALLTAAALLLSGPAQATDKGVQFVHVATAANIVGYQTDIHHPLIDGNANAVIHVTQNFNPPGGSGVYNNDVIGIWFTGTVWSIYNQGSSAMPEGAAFNIWIPPVDASSFVHTATAGNIADNYTVIDNPLSNGNPNAVLRVTQNWNPGGGGGVFNNHEIGVWYTGTAWSVFNQDSAAMPVGASFNVTVLPSDSTVSVHTATAGNTVGNWTFIDNPLTNSNPNAIVSVTQNWNPGGFGGVYNDHAIGVYYTGSKWAIFNQDIAAMPVGASFNISAPPLASQLFVQKADAGNTSGYVTVIYNLQSDLNPHAMLLVTQSWNPGGSGGTYNDHPLGVYYDGLGWDIFNQDSGIMPLGAAFNVSIPAVDASAFTHTSRADTITANWTWFSNPITDSNPNAIIHVTQNWNPSGVGGVYNAHEIGVFYAGGVSAWGIFNQDFANMPVGASFNVWIPPVGAATFVHTASAGNTYGHYTVINHPVANGNPDAIVRVTQNWNPGGGAAVYNDHAIGVYYTGSVWAIFNQDFAAMPTGASFNVTVMDPPFFADGFETGDTSRWSAALP